MATSTTNLGLIKPAGSDKIRIAQINQNSDLIDAAVGPVGSTNLQSQANALKNGMAIVSNNNTHAAITAGQYVYIYGHGTLSEGLYTATANIGANGSLSGSNVSPVSGGGLNALNSKLVNLNNDMGTTNVYVDVATQQYSQLAGAEALFNALPTVFRGTCYAKFANGYFATCLVDKNSATYGSVIYEVDWNTAPYHFVMKNGTATLDQLALKGDISTGSWESIKDSSINGNVLMNSAGRVCFIVGTLIEISDAVTTILGTIPSGKRPLTRFVVPLVNTNNLSNVGYVSISTDGSITAVNRSGTAYNNLYFNAEYPY